MIINRLPINTCQHSEPAATAGQVDRHAMPQLSPPHSPLLGRAGRMDHGVQAQRGLIRLIDNQKGESSELSVTH